MMNTTHFVQLIDGKKVFSILSESNNKKKRILIMSHGFRGTSTGPARTFVNFSKLLTSKGISTLRFDQLNCGNSEGDFIDVSFKKWVETIIYFSDKYISEGYEVALLGQSMGATASMIAAGSDELKSKVASVLLWVPDPETDYMGGADVIAEEAGEKYSTSFWREANEMDFYKCMDSFEGKIHLVYGEMDKYVSEELRNKTISKVKDLGGEVLVLKGQDHSPWEYDISHEVFITQTAFLEANFVNSS